MAVALCPVPAGAGPVSWRGQHSGPGVMDQPNPPGLFLSLFLPLEIHSSIFKDPSYNFSFKYVCLQVQELMVKLVKQTIVRRRIFLFPRANETV